MNAVFEKTGNQLSWIHQEGDRYVATGVTVHNKRFKIESVDWRYIRGINLFRGSKWLIRNGKRHKIQSVYN
jgi:hypothetical protein